MSITVVTVLYDSLNAIKQCMPSWQAAASRALPQEVKFAVLINPTGGTTDDETRRFVEKCLAPFEVVVLLPSTNIGFAGGMNRLRAECDSGHIVLLNPDVRVHSDLLLDIAQWRGRAVDSVGAIPLLTDGDLYRGTCVNAALVFADRVGSPPRRVCGLRAIGLGPSGGAAVIPTRVWDLVGGFDESMFAWGEDVNLGFGIALAGVSTVDLSTHPSDHLGGHSLGTHLPRQRRKATLLARNRCQVWASRSSRPLQLALAPFWIAFAILNVATHLRRRTALATLQGYAQGCWSWRRWTGLANGRLTLRMWWRIARRHRSAVDWLVVGNAGGATSMETT